MSIKRIIAIASFSFCLGFHLVAVAGQPTDFQQLKISSFKEIDAALIKARSRCANDQACLDDVGNLDSSFAAFKGRTFKSTAEFNSEKKKLMAAVAAINPTPNNGNGNPLNPTESQNQQQRKSDLVNEVKVSVNDAKETVKAVAPEEQKLKERLKNLERKEAGFESSAKNSEDFTKLTADANLIKDEAVGIKADALAGASPWWSSLFTLGGLIWLVLILLGLSLPALVIVSFIKLQRRVTELELHANGLRKLHEHLKKILGEVKTYSENVGSQLTTAREQMGNEIDELRQLYHGKLRNARNIQPTPDSRDVFSSPAQDSFVEVKPSFPALVSDYLSKTPINKKKELESDFRTNLLIPAPGGPFTLVEDDDGRGMGIVLPKPRLQKGTEFSSYYKSFYYCDSPSAGEVYITEPAIVNKSGAGWQLYKMGILEIR